MSCARVFIALTISTLALAAFQPQAQADLVMDFSNNAGLGYGVGTTQTIYQNGIEMQVIAGSYEITIDPYHELNLKDYTGSDGTRTVQFELTSGQLFNFINFTVGDGFGTATVTSNLGGSQSFSPNVGLLTFSGPQWQDLSWVRVSTSTQYGEMKMTPFTFQVAVPEPSTLVVAGLCGLFGFGVLVLNRRRGGRACGRGKVVVSRTQSP